MASQISINSEEMKSIYNKAMQLKGSIAEELQQLNSQITALPTRGEWQGDAAEEFMQIYSGMQVKITREFPQLLEELADNLEKVRAALVEADRAGAGRIIV